MTALDKAFELVKKVIVLDDNLAHGHGLLSNLYCYKREYDKALAEGDRAIALNPSGALTNMYYALTLIWAGRPEEAIPFCLNAIRLSPKGVPEYFVVYGSALRYIDRFDEAISAFKKALQLNPKDLSAHLFLAATYSLMGREKEARAEAQEAQRINPKFSIDYNLKITPFKDKSKFDKYFVKPLLKAGLK